MKTKLLFLAILLIALTNSNPASAEIKKVRVSSFTEVSLRIPGTLYIEQGSNQSVEIDAKSSTLDKIVAEVKGDKLILRFKNNDWFWNRIKPGEIEIHITVPEINSLSVSGSGDIIARDRIKSKTLNLAVSGSGDIKLSELISKNVKGSISGSGNLQINEGRVDEDFSISISGSGNVKSSGLESKNVYVKVSGSGKSTVWATDNLNVKVAGSGNVYYKGKPDIDSSVSGSGNVKRLK